MLIIVSGVSGETNNSTLLVSNSSVIHTLVPVLTLDMNVTTVPITHPLNVITTLTTPTGNIIAALTTMVPAETTVNITGAQNNGTKNVIPEPTALVSAITFPDVTPSEEITADPTSSIITVPVNEQFTMRAGKRVTQVQKEEAAAGYKETREAYLMQGNEVVQAAGMVSAVAPTLNPGGIPHYFGPYANYANSPMPMGRIVNITVDSGGSGYTAPIISIEDVYFTGSGATAKAAVVGGVIMNITITNGGTNYTAPVVIITDNTGTGAAATASLGGPFKSGIRKFVDTLPGLNASGANNLGNYIPVAIPNTTAYPGYDYYEIELGQFTQKLHSDLPNTTFRGYRQTNTANPALNSFHYLGPIIMAKNNTPVRVKFTNKLPNGAGGNLFLPVDTTVMGAGMGSFGMNVTPIFYTQNRAELHLHGGTTPWISDGTPHQWITPAGEYTAYPKGVSVYNVPDMPNPGNGSQTFFYTNQQSARLMWFHDHSYGITRLNVYAGEATGYLLTDPIEQDMIKGTNVTGINPSFVKVLPDLGIPLIIQDKTFVDARTIAAQDPTWNWGINPGVPRTGDLWFPHVYMPAQNPYTDTGINPYGRWHYGPWFFPPTDILHGPVANPYYTGAPGSVEPPMMPATPNPSATGEAYMDTPLINGQAYPILTLQPQTYRFRILNAANDRFFNLQLYVADPNGITADGRNNTEVKMIPASPCYPGLPATWPTDGREGGVPDPATVGPSFIYIGSEGGFLPAPVVVPNQPVTYVNDATRFDFGNVDLHTVVVAAGERADVLVDFSQYPGKTLILYNDAPAAYPAGVPQYDYYTGSPDRTDTGGAPTVQPGYGPNVRTIMQIKIANTTPAAPYNLAALQSVFAKTATKRGVFEVSQPPIIVPQVPYSNAYNQVITENNFARIADSFKKFTTLAGVQLNITFEPKALHDEMGAVYDEYGRMSGMLGLEMPAGTAVTQTFTPYPYVSPPTDVMMTSVGEMSEATPGDGTQIWKITHNGVDTHPLHWHMFNIQVINRVGWDGFIRAPDPTELGWKETLRVSPLEDTFIAIRPVNAKTSFVVPDKVRALDPSMPLGASLNPPPGGFFDPLMTGITVQNHRVNFGWEYVWHCHILAHEEMDMMHSMAVAVNKPTNAPDTLVSNNVVNRTNFTSVYLSWKDRSTNETQWIIQRRNLSGITTWYEQKRVLSSTGPQTGGTVLAIDSSIPQNTKPTYAYRVLAAIVVGDDFAYAGSRVGFPTITLNSTPSGTNMSKMTPPALAELTNSDRVDALTVAPTQASFTYTPTSGTVPLTVAFTDTSDPTTIGWEWNFGDGNLAGDNGQQNPNHVFEIPGIYTVTLTALNMDGFTVSEPSTVTVTSGSSATPPVARFNASTTSGYAPLTVTFNADTSTSEPPQWATWRWSFGDGTFSSVKNPDHTYVTGGTYTVSLAATNLGGTDITSGYIEVDAVAPVANFTGTPITGTAPLTVAFTDTSTNSPTIWNWSFGDGISVNTTVQHPLHTYAGAGIYTVSLNATNAGGSNTKTQANYIKVTPAPLIPVANFTGTPITGTAPLTVAFTDSSTNNPTVWNWSFGDTLWFNTTNVLQKNPLHTYNDAEEFTVSLTASNTNGSHTLTKKEYISVAENPSYHAQFILPNASLYQNTPTKMPVRVANITSGTGLSFNLIYNSSIIRVDDVTLNQSFTSGSSLVVNLTPGYIRVVLTSTDGITIGSPTTLILLNTTGASPIGSATQLLATDAKWSTSEFEIQHFNVINGSSVVYRIRGDFNGNGIVDIGDCARVAYMVVGKTPVDMAADFNGDGKVDVADAAKIAYYLVHKIPVL